MIIFDFNLKRTFERFRFALILVALLSVFPEAASGSRKRDLQRMMKFPQFGQLMGAVGELNKEMRLAAENPMDTWRRDRVRKAVQNLSNSLKSMASVFQANDLGDSKLPLLQQILGGYVNVNAADAYNKFLRNPSVDLIPKVGPGFEEAYKSGGPGSNTLTVEDSSTKVAKAVNGSVVTVPQPTSDTWDAINAEIADVEAGLKTKDSQVKPQYFNSVPLPLLLLTLTLADADSCGQQSNCGNSSCSDHNESGKNSAQFLMGMAMLTAVTAPMVAAAIQAGADKDIAAINQKTAIQTVQISANTSMALSQQQAAMQQQQLAAYQQTVAVQEQGATQRQAAELAALRNQQAATNQIAQDKMNKEYELSQQKIAMQQQASANQITLANATLSAQTLQANLAPSYVNGLTNPLAVTRTVGSTQVATTSNGQTAPRTTNQVPTTGNSTNPAGYAVSNRAVASSQLLSSATAAAPSTTALHATTLPSLNSGRAIKSGTASIQMVSLSSGSVVAPPMSRQLRYVMQSNLDVSGSSPERRAGSDLSLFQAQLASGESFMNYQKRSVASAGDSELVTHNPSLGSVNTSGGAYNAPSLVMEGSAHSLSGTASRARAFFNMPTK